MKRLNLTGGTYQARYKSISAQRCLNLYPEPLPQGQGEPLSYGYFPTPGLIKKAQSKGIVRCLYATSKGQLLAVIGNSLYYVSPDASLKHLSILADGTTPMQISDNSTSFFVVDGYTKRGWYGAMPQKENSEFGSVSEIKDDAYYGSSTIALLDTFFLFVQDGSAHWYTSPAQFSDEKTTPFDPLYIASASTSMGTVLAIQVLGQYIWVFGRYQTELWFNQGAADFPFQRVSGVIIECGCLSPHSIARCPTAPNIANGALIWLGVDRAGQPRVYLGQQTAAAVISTYPIDMILQRVTDLSGVIGSIYQQDGHIFYVLSIAEMASSFVYDVGVGQWHERASLDTSGNETRYKVNHFASAYGTIWAGGSDGCLYTVSLDAGDDAGTPIKRQRSFPHLLTDGQRAIHQQLMIDMQNGLGGVVSVDWSDDRGDSFCLPRHLSLGSTGNIWPTLWRLGLARDRVYRLTWSNDKPIALMGIFLQINPVTT